MARAKVKDKVKVKVKARVRDKGIRVRTLSNRPQKLFNKIQRLHSRQLIVL